MSGLGGVIGAEGLVALLEGGGQLVLIDSRPFVDFNSAHILEAVNVNCSKLMKRRLQQDKVTIRELLLHSSNQQLDLQGDVEVVVYDQSSSDPSSLSAESFLNVLLIKLRSSFTSVHLLSGGFSGFSSVFPALCEGFSSLVPSCISQPCLPVSNTGPTRILPHLYLGCQRDVLNKDLMQQIDIVYVLNASNSCPKPDFIPESHFLRVPVNDSFGEKILPWLDRSLDFIEKAKACNSRVLVHCLAGISRSATIAIAYIMKRMDLSLDEAYRFVKEKRPTISPNFNFLGQLLDFERRIKSPEVRSGGGREEVQETAPPPLTLPCILAPPPEERLQALQLSDPPEDSARMKRSFSLDIKAYGEQGGGAPHRGGGGGGVLQTVRLQ
ncbi:hypothetical protein PBY51_009122 [Eleginops maclovinus]|uniref:Dual specificity phosphatase 16 n=1 Tax=Eleginops maclovinus TaxID=56733 RepID=A0AAN7WUF9_ELEMC|nr:hypothetical protein PBY51_009122 [Eleginops maclovinus]